MESQDRRRQRLGAGTALRAEDGRQDGGLALLSRSQQAGGGEGRGQEFLPVRKALRGGGLETCVMRRSAGKDLGGKRTLGRGNSKCKYPEVGMSLGHSRNGEKKATATTGLELREECVR